MARGFGELAGARGRRARRSSVFTEKAGVNTVVVDSTDNLRGALGNLAFSLALYSGQMCTTPQNIYVPEDGIDTDEGHLSFEELGDRLAAAIGRLTGDDARAVEILGATVNDQVRGNAAGIEELAQRGWRVRGSRAPRGDATPHTPTPSSALRAWWPWTPRARRSTRRSASAR